MTCMADEPLLVALLGQRESQPGVGQGRALDHDGLVGRACGRCGEVVDGGFCGDGEKIKFIL